VQLVLSLFPGIGLFDAAFTAEGFCVVRGPDVLWGSDVKDFHVPKGKFDGIVGGPPCQAFSRLRHIIIANGYELAPNLIPEFERVVWEAEPRWWVMENVENAPLPVGATGHASLRDYDCGGLTSRVRRFSWSGVDLRLPPVTKTPAPYKAVVCDARTVPIKIGGSGKRKPDATKQGAKAKRLSVAEMLELQGHDPALLDECPLTLTGKRKVIGNGVPMAMGLAVARAIKESIGRG